MAVDHAQVYLGNLVPYSSFGSQDLIALPSRLGFGGSLGGGDVVFPNQQQPRELNSALMNQKLGLVLEKAGDSIDISGGLRYKYNGSITSAFYLDQPLNVEYDKQIDEIDHFLQLQSESLRYTIQHQSNEQLAILLGSLESKAKALMKEKERQGAEAINRGKQLEDSLSKAEIERAAWEKVAIQNEAMVIAHNNTLYQVKQRLNYADDGCRNWNNEDAESVCDQFRGKETEEGSRRMMKLCKRCRSGELCVVFLPCRHLCSCKSCEPLLHFCPVCDCAKQGSIEVFFS